MVVYFIILGILALMQSCLNRVRIIFHDKSINKEAFLCVAWLLLSIIQGFRAYSVGTDTSAYVSLFRNPAPSLEVGFKIFLIIIQRISNNPTFFLVVCALLTNGLVCLAIYRMSKDVFLSVYLYVTLYYYFISFNALRQYLAIAILLNAFYYAAKRKWKAYILLELMAISFHTVSVVGLVYILFFNGQKQTVTWKKVTLIASGGLVATLSLNTIIQLAMQYFPRYQIYSGSGYLTDVGGIQQPIVNSAILVCFLLFASKETKKNSIFLLPCLIAAILSILQMQLYSVQRVLWCFDLFSIFLLPEVLSANILNGQSKTVLRAAIVCVSLLFMTYYLSVNYMRVSNYSFAF